MYGKIKISSNYLNGLSQKSRVDARGHFFIREKRRRRPLMVRLRTKRKEAKAPNKSIAQKHIKI